MKQTLFLVIILTLCMLFIPGFFDTNTLFILGVDIATWIGGIGIIVISSLAIFLSKENLKSNKKRKTIKNKK
ncbi:MAG: hypothetical protein WCX96_02810 [Bacilli bacterium]